eukprot:Rhum_TRINITY_DN14317_c4_g2::Rhum_TRINITY_DN14317_c4_g2_i1::g.80323::m.80323
MFHDLTGAEADATAGRLDIGVPLMNMDGSASLRPTTLHTTPLITREEATRHRNRRTVKEYRVWGEGLRGSLRLFISLTGTVWAPIFPQILLILLCTGGVTLFHTYVMAFTYPMTGHQIVLVPMSFLLVFRCSNSYQRYWDGRSLLGSLVYSCRELVSKAYLYPTTMHVEASWGSSDATRAKRTQRVVDRFSDDCKRYVMCVAMLINATVGRYWDVIEEQRRTRKTTKAGSAEPGGCGAAGAPTVRHRVRAPAPHQRRVRRPVRVRGQPPCAAADVAACRDPGGRTPRLPHAAQRAGHEPDARRAAAGVERHAEDHVDAAALSVGAPLTRGSLLVFDHPHPPRRGCDGVVRGRVHVRRVVLVPGAGADRDGDGGPVWHRHQRLRPRCV